MKSEKTVNFSEIFEFAEKEFQVDWNQANDLFFNNVLEYKSFNRFYLGDLEGEVECIQEEEIKNDKYLNKKVKPYQILIAFMKEHNLKEMLVLNN